jgi:hypothetical protein
MGSSLPRKKDKFMFSILFPQPFFPMLAIHLRFSIDDVIAGPVN